MARTFWNSSEERGDYAQVSPLEIHIHLDERFEPKAEASDMLRGAYASLTDSIHSGLGSLIERVRYRFDEKWTQYYEMTASDEKSRAMLVRTSLGAVAFDVPLLLAFFLLLNAKDATRTVAVLRAALNRKRLARDRPPLLDHVEVNAFLPAHTASFDRSPSDNKNPRRPPRLHHVRGHLVRRENRVFWRIPHLRGSARAGLVRSRTVCLSFPPAS
jgi:hypothetical protein